jgi:hypothetical protein
MCIWKCYVFAGKHGHKGRSHNKVQRSNWGVPFVFESMMKSLPKVARIEVLQRNILEDWSVKDWTSCEKTLHLGHEYDIVKMVQLEGAKCKLSRGPTCVKGRPNRAKMGLGRSTQGGRPDPFRRRFGPSFLELEDDTTLSTWRRRHSQRESHSLERSSTS